MKTAAHMQPDARIATPQLIQAMLAAADHVSDLIFSPGRAPQIESKGELIEVKFKGLETADPAPDHGDRRGPDRHQRRDGRDAQARRVGGHLVRARRRRPVPRQHLPPARVVRDRHARHSDEDSVVPGPGSAGGAARDRAAAHRHRARDRSDRVGQVLDARRDRRSHERRAARSTSSRSRIRSSSCTRTSTRRSTSASCTATRRRSAWRFARPCARRRRSSWSARCAIARRSRSRSKRRRPGHLVMSTLHTIDAAKTVERIVGMFPQGDQRGIRTRLAKAFQYIVSQRLRAEEGRHGPRGTPRDPRRRRSARASTSSRARRTARRCSTPCRTAPTTGCSTSTAKSRS